MRRPAVPLSTWCVSVCILLGVNSRVILARLRADGWFEVARRGSHVQLKHPTKPGKVTVSHPKRDLPAGTVRSIERQAGVRLLG